MNERGEAADRIGEPVDNVIKGMKYFHHPPCFRLRLEWSQQFRLFFFAQISTIPFIMRFAD